MKTPIGTDISYAVALLKKGQLVAIPTETVYGLAANALNPEAVIKIFEAKNRPAFDPLIVHVSSVHEMEKYGVLPAAACKLASSLGPAPITYVVPVKDIIPGLVTSGLPTVGLRIPNHPLSLALLHQIDFPLAAPSANPFGYVSPTSANHVHKQLAGKINYILDGGPCQIGLESTIIDFSQKTPKILRTGGFSLEAIEELLGEKVLLAAHSSSRPQAPGMLESHYAPLRPVVLEDWAKLEARPKQENTGWLLFNRTLPNQNPKNQIVLSKSGDLNEAARNLFAGLRAFDEMPINKIYAAPVPDVGLGRAINDRLRRAAGKG
jgi:L-threonylcarbamoyladenylate synthase